MKLLLIKQNGNILDVSSDRLTIETIYFDAEKYKGKLQEFVGTLSFYSFDGIIISDTLDSSLNYLGLELCLRIRLSSKDLGNKAFSSFFIFNSKNPQEIYKYQVQQKANTTASLFFTDGTFSFVDNESLKYLIESDSNYKILNESNFNETFLDVIQLKKNPHFGNHTIANVWGAIRFAEVTGHTKLLQDYFDNNPIVTESQSDIYFKLLLSKNIFSNHTRIAKRTINATGKNILLIDDEEEKGWGLLLKELFQGSNFVSIKKSENFINDIKAKINEKNNEIIKWDLVLLDLRLLENEDKGEESLKISSEYSGGFILKEIKKENKGTQVIMFTASNKAWNMKELQELGADGFYIKESPEYSKDHKFSIENYNSLERQIYKCFLRSPLKDIYYSCEQIKHKFKKNPLVKYFPSGLAQLKGLQYQNLLLNELDTIFEIINSENQNRLNHSMLMQFKILECIAEIFITGKIADDLKFWDCSNVQFYSGDSSTLLNRTDDVLVYKHDIGKKVSEKIPRFWYESTGNKIHALMSQKLSIALNDPIHRQIDNLVIYRNRFIHPKDRMGLTPLRIEDIQSWMLTIFEIVKRV